jgi:uncharacterized membrane protein YeaQ/YmgE (transglycosylase-associated protein family)
VPFVGFLLFGALIGAAIRLLVAKRGGGWTVSMSSGAGGAFLGGLLGRGGELRGDLGSAGFVTSLLGAFALVAVYHVTAATLRMNAD